MWIIDDVNSTPTVNFSNWNRDRVGYITKQLIDFINHHFDDGKITYGRCNLINEKCNDLLINVDTHCRVSCFGVQTFVVNITERDRFNCLVTFQYKSTSDQLTLDQIKF